MCYSLASEVKVQRLFRVSGASSGQSKISVVLHLYMHLWELDSISIYQHVSLMPFLDVQVSLAPTHVRCWSVRRSVTLLDFLNFPQLSTDFPIDLITDFFTNFPPMFSPICHRFFYRFFSKLYYSNLYFWSVPGMRIFYALQVYSLASWKVLSCVVFTSKSKNLNLSETHHTLCSFIIDAQIYIEQR